MNYLKSLPLGKIVQVSVQRIIDLYMANRQSSSGEAKSLIDDEIKLVDGQIERLDKLLQLSKAESGEPKTIPQETPAPALETVEKAFPPSVTEEQTIKYQFDLIIDDLQHLETEHLPQQGRIMGQPCDCIAKAARSLKRHAKETIPIAARQGKDPALLSEVGHWAEGMMEIGTLEAASSGQFDEQYLREAGTASTFRKQFEGIWSEVGPKGAVKPCEECVALEDLRAFLERQRAQREKGKE